MCRGGEVILSKITLVVLKNPFNHEGREIHSLEFIPEKTIAQYVQPYMMGLDDFIYSAQGVKVEGEYVPEPGDYLAVCPVVGKSKLLGSLLSIGLAVWTGGLAEGGFWGLKAGSFAAGLAASAIAYVGGMVINHFFPPATPDMPDSTSSTPTYGWGNVSAQVTQGGVLPRTFGTMKTAGIELTRYISVDGDKQYLNVLYTGGQGPIDDITDIQINGNPIENFTEVQVDTRLGTNDQTVIPNFGDTFASQNMNYELRDNEWSTQLTEGNAGEGLQVMVEFPNGLYHMNDSGGLENAWVRLASEYRKEGGEWVPWLSQSYVSSTSVDGATCYPNAPGETWTIKVSGVFANVTGSASGGTLGVRGGHFDNGKIKCVIPSSKGTYTIIVVNNERITAAQNTAVRRTFRVDNIPAGRYEVRMKVIERSAATNSTRDSVRVYWNQLSQIIYDDFSRPNKILIGIRALATDQLNGNDITITWKQHKETVLVWNPVSGEYEEKNARNAAWVCYDMIHGARQLVNIATGENEIIVDNVPASRTDYQAFSEWAAHLDTLGLEFEHTFDSAADLWSSLKAPESFGRGKVIMKGTRFSCVCDKPSTPVQLFTVGNIDQGSFNKDYLGLTDRANAVEITFVNRDKGYQKDAFTVYGDGWNESIVQGNPTQITLNGCTSYQQAYQHGKYLLRLNKYLLRTVTWEADIDAIACQIGDQVLLQHDVPEWGMGGRLVAATANVLTLDKPVTMEPGKTYGVYVRLIDDTLVNKYVVNTGGETEHLTVTTAFSVIPQEYDIFAFGEITKVAKPFSVVSVDRKDDLTYTLTGIEYVPAVYEESLDAPVIQYSAADMTPPEITGLSVAQETYRQKDGTVVSVINCSWLLPQKAVNSLVVYYQEEGESTWKKWADQQEPVTTIAGVKSLTSYRVKVCTISSIGVISPGIESDPIYITGKDSPPSNVLSIAAIVDQSDSTKIQLSWPAVDDIDLNGYQVMEGSTVLTANPISDTRYTYTATSSRQHAFSVRAVDNSGNLSEIPATATINVTIEPAQVAGFSITAQETDRSKLLLTWQANTEQDISYYEIRQGDSWSTAQIIATQLKATSYAHSLTAEGSQKLLVKAINVAGYYSVNAAQQTIQAILRPDTPTGLTAVQDPKDRSVLKLSWTASPGKDIAGYELRRGTVWDTAEQIDTTRETSYRYAVSASASFTIMVRAKTVAGNLSNIASIPVTMVTEPSNVTGFGATQSDTDKRIIKFTWTGISDPDLSYYEIREGANWSASTLIATKIGSTYYDYKATAERTATYLIKAVNKSDKYSNDPASTVVAISLTPSRPGSGSVISDTANRLKLLITWDKIADLDIDYYEVKYGSTVIATPKDTTVSYTVAAGGTHAFTVRARNLAGFYSSVLSLTGSVVAEPSDVPAFTAKQRSLDRTILDFAWTTISDTDFAYYEIRKGANWSTAAVVATKLKTAEYSAPATSSGATTYLIKAVNAAGYASVNAKAAALTINFNPTQPATGSVMQDPKDKSVIVISWGNVTDADLLYYEIRRGTSWSTGTKIFEGKETSFRFPITTNGTYPFMVCSKNVGGYYSSPLNLSIAATINPGDVTGFSATQSMNNRSVITLHWDTPIDLDISHHEIRMGATWDTATVIGSRLSGTMFEVQVMDESVHSYFIKSVSVAGYYSQNAAEIEGVFNLNPSPVSNIQITQNQNDRSQLIISWSGISESDLVFYELRTGYEWDTAVKIAETKETRWLHSINNTGDVKVMIKSKNAADFYSDEVYEHYYATVEPGPVTGFTAIQNGEYVELFWDKHSESDVVSYEISEGASFDMGQLIVSGVTTTEYTVKVDTERNYYYHIKAINRALKYSTAAASTGLYVANLPIKNVIQEYDEIALQTGAKTNVEFGASLINWSNLGGRFPDYPTTKFSDVGGQTVLKLKKRNLLTANQADMETDLTGISILQGAGGTGTLQRSIERSKSGLAAVKLTKNGAYIFSRHFSGGVSGGGKYTYSAWVYVVNQSKILAVFRQNAGTAYVPKSFIVTPNQWTRISHTITYDASVTSAQVDIGWENVDAPDGTVCFIDCVQWEIGDLTPYSSYFLSGAYQSITKDMGQVITANITADFRSTVVLRGLGSAVLQIRTSQDGTNWTAWQDFKPAQYTFRYLDARVLLATEDPTNTPEVNHLDLRIDVPDTDKKGSIVIPVGGATVGYGHTYYSVPVVTPTAIGENRSPELIGKTNTGFTVKIKDRTGTDVGGTLDWLAKGY